MEIPFNQLNYWVARALLKAIEFSPANAEPGIAGLGNIRVADEEGEYIRFDPAHCPRAFNQLQAKLGITMYAPGHPDGMSTSWFASIPGWIENGVLVPHRANYGSGRTQQIAGCRAIVTAAFRNGLPAQ